MKAIIPHRTPSSRSFASNLLPPTSNREAVASHVKAQTSNDRRPFALSLFLLLILVLLTILPGRASAQPSAEAEVQTQLRSTRTFTPRIQISETYDDNINLTRKNKESDWITTVSPGFNVAVDSEHTKLSLDVFGGYSFYAQDSSQDTYNLGTTLSLDQRLSSRLSVRATDAFVRTDDPITTENGVVTNVARKRQVSYANTGEAGLSYQFGPENTLTGGYRNHYVHYSSDQYETSLGNEVFATLVTWFGPRFGTELSGGVTRATFDEPNNFTGTSTEDFYNYNGGVTLNYRWEPTRRVFVRYTVLEHRFDQTNLDPANQNQNYLVQQPTVGVSLGLGPYTTFDAEGGYWYQNVYGGDSRSGPAFNTSLSTRRDKLTLRVGGNGGYDESYFTSENLGFAKYYQALGNADYQLTQALAFFASGSYRWEKYYNTTEETTNQPTDRTDKTWQAIAGFRCTFLRYLTFSLDGTHTEVSSTENDQEFTDNRVTARLTWAYGIPF